MSLFTAWESLAGRSNCTFEQFKDFAKDAEVHDVFVDNKDVGAVIVIGAEVHACIKPEGFKRWYGKAQRRILNNIISKHGYATTSVTEGNAVGDKFVRGLGFVRTQSANGIWKYRKE